MPLSIFSSFLIGLVIVITPFCGAAERSDRIFRIPEKSENPDQTEKSTATPSGTSGADTTGNAGNETEQSRTSHRHYSVTGFPVILYMPETSAIFGGGATITIRNQNRSFHDRPDLINFHAIYTLKKQVACNLEPVFYFDEYKWKVKPLLAYQKFPDSFYGIGNRNTGSDAESYTMEDFLFRLRITRLVYRNLRLGFRYDLKNTNVLKVENDGILATGELNGTDGSFLACLGAAFEWDSRDNIFYPSKGAWIQFYAMLYRKWTGSDYTFNSYTFDFRYYFTVTGPHILAFQLLGTSTPGDIPFSEYNRLEFMRGIHGSRFRDHIMFMSQLEYRYPVYKRFSGILFGAAGDVSDKISGYRIKDMKYSLGLGLRYLVNPKEKINFRLDIGMSRWGISPYFQITEAF